MGSKDNRYNIHPTETILLGLRAETKSITNQYQVQNNTQIRKNQKVIKNDNDELIDKIYPKFKQPNVQQRKLKPPGCPSCNRNILLEFDKGWYCQNCEKIINKQKHQIDKY